ncbi:FAD-binding protein [Candidatus Poriferisocius sp.]|uniref:FAD-binding protein n=1 Tax=Candidatus Poriferisocius sp. TaxID=3101276 RepID=UPI003B01CF53
MIAPDRPLRVAVLAKQIPVFEDMVLGPDGRMVRDGIDLHMNDYCRRAVAKGTEMARAGGGEVIVFTLGPPSAENVCREAILYGVDGGVHICDPAFAGSDTWATAKALVAALERFGPFDLVMVGRNSVDADTGQVPPQVAELLGLPLAAGVRYLSLRGDRLELRLEHDDEWVDCAVELPAVLSCAERLCDPCKIKDPVAWSTVDGSAIQTVSAVELGPGPWGQAASPTSVGPVRMIDVERGRRMMTGTLVEQVDAAVAAMVERGVLTADRGPDPDPVPTSLPAASDTIAVAVLVEPERGHLTRELLGAAARLAKEFGGGVAALGTGLSEELGPWGADQQIHISSRSVPAQEDTAARSTGSAALIPRSRAVGDDPVEEDVAAAVSAWAVDTQPQVVLAPGTAWGREVASRIAAALGAGLTGDAVGLRAAGDGRMIASKPAFGGWLVAEIGCSSPIQMATVRPGVLPRYQSNPHRPPARRASLVSPGRSRLEIIRRYRDDDSDELANASVVIGVGQGVDPAGYPELEKHRAAIGATLCATRKVTDYGWMPRARQVGITGHSISPRLYIAIGTSGKFNHTVGVRNAGMVVGINPDPDAPLWDVVDIGIVGDWAEVFDALIPRMVEAGLG